LANKRERYTGERRKAEHCSNIHKRFSDEVRRNANRE
jgi:hypothetical protein